MYSCTNCGQTKFSKVLNTNDYISGETFTLEKCATCQLARTVFPTDEKSITKYYPIEYFGGRKSFTDSYINQLRIKGVNKNTHIINGKKILDVGCGTGTFLSLLAREGWHVNGTETSIERVENCKKNNIDVCHGTLSSCKYKQETFNCITFWHVLEHVVNPRSNIKEAHRILKESGSLILEVPNLSSWQAKLSGGNWFHLDVPRHLFHFSKKNLIDMVSSEGFEIVSLSTISPFYDIFGTIQSFINIFTKRKNLLFDLLNGKLTFQKAIRKHGVEVFLTFIGTPLFGIFAVIMFIVSIPFKQGGVIILYAKKR